MRKTETTGGAATQDAAENNADFDTALDEAYAEDGEDGGADETGSGSEGKQPVTQNKSATADDPDDDDENSGSKDADKSAAGGKDAEAQLLASIEARAQELAGGGQGDKADAGATGGEKAKVAEGTGSGAKILDIGGLKLRPLSEIMPPEYQVGGETLKLADAMKPEAEGGLGAEFFALLELGVTAMLKEVLPQLPAPPSLDGFESRLKAFEPLAERMQREAAERDAGSAALAALAEELKADFGGDAQEAEDEAVSTLNSREFKKFVKTGAPSLRLMLDNGTAQDQAQVIRFYRSVSAKAVEGKRGMHEHTLRGSSAQAGGGGSNPNQEFEDAVEEAWQGK